MFSVGYSLAQGIDSFQLTNYPIVDSSVDKKSPLGMRAAIITDIALSILAALMLLSCFLAFAFTGSVVPAIIAAGCAGFLLIQATCRHLLKRYILENHENAVAKPLI